MIREALPLTSIKKLAIENACRLIGRTMASCRLEGLTWTVRGRVTLRARKGTRVETYRIRVERLESVPYTHEEHGKEVGKL